MRSWATAKLTGFLADFFYTMRCRILPCNVRFKFLNKIIDTNIEDNLLPRNFSLTNFIFFFQLMKFYLFYVSNSVTVACKIEPFV